jgi:hypothetical protein
MALHGQRLIPLDRDELVPLPRGAVLSMLPERTAIAREGALPGAPAAALLPIGFTRTLLPAYLRVPSFEFRVSSSGFLQVPGSGFQVPSYLPLFGYAAVAFVDGEPYVAAMPTDDPRPWQHPDPGYRRLRRLIRNRINEAEHASTRNPEPGTRNLEPEGTRNPEPGTPRTSLLAHIAHCALTYECRSAQHLFYGEGEAALPSSPTCNAACVGCISDQPDPDLQPHARLDFLPDMDESVELAVRHLEAAPRAIISFGQGCEGEPLLNNRNVEIVRRIRRRTSKGVINVNTNGSRPAMLRKLIDAGLGSIRVSVFSARDDVFRRYYRPVRYSLEHVRECLRLASANGLFTSVNLLTFPGITDDAAEVEAMVDLLTTTGAELVQLRNLNIDPEQLFASMDGLDFQPIGIRAMATRFKQAGLAIGSYTHTRVSGLASQVSGPPLDPRPETRDPRPETRDSRLGAADVR